LTGNAAADNITPFDGNERCSEAAVIAEDVGEATAARRRARQR
jgi:hypothetical protein